MQAESFTSWRTTGVALSVALVLTMLWCGLVYREPRALHVPSEALPATMGLHSVEQFTDRDERFRWTKSTLNLILPNPGGQVHLRMQLSSGFPERFVPVQLATTPVAAFTVGPALRTYHLLLGPDPREPIALGLSTPPFSPASDPRELGLVFAEVRLDGGTSPVLVIWLAALASTLGLFFAGRMLVKPRPAALAATLGTGALLWWHASGGWLITPLAPVATVTVLAVALVSLTGQLGRMLFAHERLLGQSKPRTSTIRQPARSWHAGEPGYRFGEKVKRPTFSGDATAQRIFPLVAGALIALVMLPIVIWNVTMVNPEFTSDLGIYLAATRDALAGGNPYEPFVIGVSYIYPPASLPVFLPFALLPPPTYDLLWRALSLVAALAALLALWRSFGQPERAAAIGASFVGLWVVSGSLWETLSVGQVNAVVLLGITLFLLGYRYPRWAWVGDLGLALAIVLKLSPALLLAVPLVRGELGRLVRVAVGAVALGVLALIWFPAHLWVDFATIAPMLLGGADANPYNYALGAFADRVIPGFGWVGRIVAIALIGAWLVFIVMRRRAEPTLLLALGVLVMTIAPGLVWYHHLIFLAVPTALVLLNGTSRAGWLALGSVGLLQLLRPLDVLLGLPPWIVLVAYLCLLWAVVETMAELASSDVGAQFHTHGR
ncbi:glycosyltransferase family 87 protein [Candidatus Chloroploca sp. Khr17]|uniref:glycosyltransferase family 87 protein n=1 Tax=Candidatus Chloroploca sp. Khr17 TaxID=2496869 RepID=UPI00101CE92C|nr:glycosyltransferase family 87 protein [Candidatus Chloroploca sp. Khr17]